MSEAQRALRAAVATLVDDPQIRRGISPGFYFQRCLRIWEPGLRGIVKQKAMAVRPLVGREEPAIVGDAELHRALLARQAAAFAGLRERCDGLERRLQSLTPFITGIGQPHPLENGFAFLKPYGLPYLAASGVKGAVRAACVETWRERYAGDEAAVRGLSKHYFGSDDKGTERGEVAEHARGALVFLDLLPEPVVPGPDGKVRPLYRLDIVNPHYMPYYEGRDVPADWHSPVPSNFLTLRDGLSWTLRVVYAPLNRDEARQAWLDDVRPGIERALTAGGFGAKKTWGYGLFAVQPGEQRAGPTGGTQAEAQRTAPGAAAGAGSAPAPPPKRTAPQSSADARAAENEIQTLSPNSVKGRLGAIEQYVAGARPEEQPALLDLLERRLREFGLKHREVTELMARVRGRLSPPPAPGDADA